MSRLTFHRRTILATLAAPILHRAWPAPPSRVVWVLDAGGVRVGDTWDADSGSGWPAIAQQGTLFRTARAAGSDRAQALAALLRGGLPEDGEALGPTLFEHAIDAGLRRSEVWWLDSQRDAQLAWSPGRPRASRPLHFRPDCAVERPFTELRKQLEVEAGGTKPSTGSPASEALDAALGGSQAAVDAATQAAIRRYLAAEKPDSQAGASDARALRAAIELLKGARPRLMGVHLTEAARAEHSVEDYRTVLAARRVGLAELLARIASDPELASSTTVVWSSERGRNRKVQGHRLLDDDGSPAVSRVGVFLSGPKIQRKHVPRRSVKTLDVFPTITKLLGIETPKTAQGRVLDSAFDS